LRGIGIGERGAKSRTREQSESNDETHVASCLLV
jgi:hypothetical protein